MAGHVWDGGKSDDMDLALAEQTARDRAALQGAAFSTHCSFMREPYLLILTDDDYNAGANDTPLADIDIADDGPYSPPIAVMASSAGLLAPHTRIVLGASAADALRRLRARAGFPITRFRHPDIVICYRGYPSLAIEIDGSYHDSPAGRRSTDRRDRDYHAIGLPSLAIRKSEYPAGPYGLDGWGAALAHRLDRVLPMLAAVGQGGQNARAGQDGQS